MIQKTFLRKQPAIFIASLTLTAGAAHLSAELVIHESFDYERRQGYVSSEIPGEGIQGLNGGIGFMGTWTKLDSGRLNAGIPEGPGDYGDGDTYGVTLGARTAPLAYTDSLGNALLTSGNQIRTAFGHNSWNQRELDWDAAGELFTNDQTVWISFLAQAHGQAGSSRWAFVELTNSAGGDRLWIGNVNPVSSGNWGIFLPDRTFGSYSEDAGDDYPMDEPTLFLLKLEYGSAFEMNISTWINPDDLTNEGNLPAPVFDVETDLSNFSDLGVAGRYSTDFDEIRIGTTFDSVTPTEFVGQGEPPVVAIDHDGENVVVSWPTDAEAYSLYTSTDLVDWTPVSEEPVVEGEMNEITQPLTNDRQFFRLQQ